LAGAIRSSARSGRFSVEAETRAAAPFPAPFLRLAEKLGFEVERIQTAFPDCEALREVAKDKWQRVKIEFEYASRNFLDHKHPPKGCDLIVCWIHNWPECPKHLEVIELRRVVRGM
jgi:hypothetical protein